MDEPCDPLPSAHTVRHGRARTLVPPPSPLPATYAEVLENLGERTLLAVQGRHLKRLIAARIARDEAEFQLDLAEAEVGLAAKAAYEAGDSWRTIGVVLGISRQGGSAALRPHAAGHEPTTSRPRAPARAGPRHAPACMRARPPEPAARRGRAGRRAARTATASAPVVRVAQLPARSAAWQVEGDRHGRGVAVPDRGAGDRQAGEQSYAGQPEPHDRVAGVAAGRPPRSPSPGRRPLRAPVDICQSGRRTRGRVHGP